MCCSGFTPIDSEDMIILTLKSVVSVIMKIIFKGKTTTTKSLLSLHNFSKSR